MKFASTAYQYCKQIEFGNTMLSKTVYRARPIPICYAYRSNSERRLNISELMRCNRLQGVDKMSVGLLDVVASRFIKEIGSGERR